MNSERYNLIAVIGPTAGGKTSFAARLAHELNGEIISADSRQVYRRMDLGTGKDIQDYMVMGRRIPVHLVDIAEPGYRYSVFEFQRDFFKAYREITSRGKIAILCGGSGMYIQSVTQNYLLLNVPVNYELRDQLKDKPLPELAAILAEYKTLHNKTDTDTIEHALRAIEIQEYYKKYPPFEGPFKGPLKGPSKGVGKGLETLFLGVMYDRETERARITERLERRLKEGLVEEVRELLDSGISPESLMYYGLEYRYVTLYLSGKLEYNKMVSLLNTAIHQFAKRQRTWFRKMEREGSKIHWIPGELSMDLKIEKAKSIWFAVD